MKRLMKYVAIFVLPLLFAAGYCVPQMAFGAGIEANTVLNFIEYTPTPGPTPGPTPTPTPTPDPGVIGGLTPQTGDFVAIAIGLLGIIAAISLAFVLRRHISYNFKSLFAAFCVSMLPLALAGTCVAGLNNAAARDAGSLVSKQIDVYVNTEGGPVHYGEGEASNVQTFVNTTDNPIYIDEIALEITSDDGSVDIGTWNAKVGGETIFSGVAGDSKKLAKSIYLDPDESFEVTWETEASSEDLIGLVGTAPVKISYKTYDSECTVTFETNGGSTIAPAKVTYGDKLTKPADPTKKDNVLKYWASDEALTHEYDFSTVVTSNFTLYAYWNASEEYKEEIEEEMAADLKEAKDNVDTIEGLTDAQKEALDEALDDLIDEYNEKIKKAKTQDEVDDLKAEFEDKVLDKEKEALGQSLENREKAVDDKLDDIEGLTEADLNRYKSDVTNKKNDAKNKIAAAEDFASAQKQQEKFNSDTDAVYAEAKKLGEAKKAAKATSEEEAKKSEAEFITKYQDSLLPDTLTAFQEKFDAVDADTKEDIDDAISPSEVQEALANEQKDLKDLFDEAQEILDTKGAYLAAAKATTDEDTVKVEALKNVSQKLKDDAKSKIYAAYTALQENIAKTDDLNKLKEIKDAFDANVLKIVEDIEKLDQDIDDAKSEIGLKTKQISKDIQAKGINQFDALELDNELKKMSDSIQLSLANASSQEELKELLKDGKAQLENYSSSIVIVALNFAVGQESMANYAVSTDQGETPVMNRAGRVGQNANTKINIKEDKTRIQSIVDNNTKTYTPTSENAFRFTFDKSITTITTTLEVVPDEGYAYLTKTTKDNDTLVFTYDGDRSKKPEGTTFDVEDTDVVFGPGWGDYMYGSKTSITKVVIEASFHNVKPKCLAKWFMQSSVEYKQILKEIKGLGNIDTSEVTYFNSTFFGNVSIQKFEGLENWDTGKVTSAEAMFMNCKALKDVSNITGWYFASREKFSCPLMFCQCSSLENFAGFNKNHTVSASYVYNMFAGCSMLTSVDILNFNLTSATSYEMFSGCNNLHNIFYKDDASKSIGQSNDMFKDCIALPHFKDNVVDATYAYPNNGLDGYFTDPHPTIILNSFTGGYYEKVEGGEITEIDGDWNADNIQVRIVTSATVLSVKDNAGRDYALIDNCFFVDFSARYSITVTTTSGYSAKAYYTTEDFTLTFYYDNTTHPGTPIDVPDKWYLASSPFEEAKDAHKVKFDEGFINFQGITHLIHWFEGFSQLEEVIGIEYLYTDNVVNMGSMFLGSAIRNLDLSSNCLRSLNTISSIDYTFSDCLNLESVIFPDNIEENATCAYTFKNAKNLSYVNCGKLKMAQAGTWTTFEGCERINTITTHNSWSSTLAAMLGENSGYSMWHVASAESNVYSNTISGNANGDTYTKLEGYALLTSNNDSNDTLTFKYDHLRSSYQQDHTFDVENTTESNIPWAEYIGGISGSTGTVTTVDFDPSFVNVRPKSCASWFKGAGGGSTSIVNVNNASNLNTSEATDLSWMFTRCKNMVNPPDTSTWNTAKATNIKYIFASCENMVGTPDMSNWDTSSMTDISGLFENCQKMEEPPNTSNWVTNSVTDMSCMFHHAYQLKTAPNMSSWNTSLVTNMTAMFSRCEIVTEIDIRSFTFTPNTITGDRDGIDFGMFNGCYKIEHIYYDEDISNVLAESKSGNMFSGCTRLPHYTEVTDDTLRNNKYAYPDNGQTGYFTSKTPNITLSFAQGSHGHFEDPATPGVAITTFEGTYGAQGVKVKPVADSGYLIDTIVDNNSPQPHTYTIDENGCIELRFDAEYTITATTKASLQAYAYLTETTNENDTLVFAYDSEMSSHEPLAWNCENTGSNVPWGKYVGQGTSSESTVTTVQFTDDFKSCNKVSSCANWFNGWSNTDRQNYSKITTFINTSGTNFTNVTSMAKMFWKANKFETPIDMSGWETSDKLTNLDQMFYDCSSMKTPPDVSVLDTENVTNLSNLFCHCAAMESAPNVSDWNVGNVTSFDSLFYNCTNMADAPDTSSWEVSNKATTLIDMFYGCENMETAPNMSNWDTSRVTDMHGMFSGCRALTEIDITDLDFDASPCVGGVRDGDQLRGMFYGCENLQNIYCDKDLSNTLSKDTSWYMFYYASKLPHYSDVKADDPNRDCRFAYPDNGTTGYFKMPSIPEAYAAITSSENGVNDTLELHYDCDRSNYEINFNNILDLGDKNNPPWYEYTGGSTHSVDNVVILEDFAKVKPKSMRRWFTSSDQLAQGNIKSITGLANIDTSEVTTMTSLFDGYGGSSIEGISLWDTSKVKTFVSMFKYSSYLSQTPDLSGWDTSSAVSFSDMFNNSTISEPPDTSNWVTENVTEYTRMFSNCKNLTTGPDMSNWKFPTKQGVSIYMNYTFNYCESLEEININNFTFENSPVVYPKGMFGSCWNLSRIICDNNWSTHCGDSSDMFSSNILHLTLPLPHWTSGSTDATYAYPDNGATGYFTPENPTITLTFAEGSNGYYVDKEEQQITDGKVTLSYDQFDFKVKPVCSDSGMVVKKVVDNKAPTPTEYTIDADGYITLDPSAEFTLTAITGQTVKPKAVLDERPASAGDWTFTIYYDDIDHETTDVYQYDVINTSWDIKSKQVGTKATWCKVASDRGVVFPTVDDGIIPGKIIIDESFKNCTKDCNGTDLTSMAFWFAGMNSVTSVEGLENIPSSITDMTGLFSKFLWDEGEGVIEDSTLDLSDLNTDNVTDVQAMLAGNWFDIVTLPNGFLPQIKIAGGYVTTDDTSYIRGLGVFSEMKTFTLNINGKILAEDGVTNAEFLFYGCQQLKSLSLTPDVINLAVLDNAQFMFYWMRSLEELDLSGHAAMPITRGMQMFAGCPNLKTIKLEHDLSSTINPSTTFNMFSDCTSLLGGDGLKCSGDKISDDYKYAKPGNFATDGYFTYSGNGSSTLRYDLNGQACDETHNAAYFNYSQTVMQGESFTVQGATKLPDPVGTGETVAEFEYWYLSGDPSETKIDAESELNASASELSLVAKWNIHDKTAKAVYTNDGTLTFYYDSEVYEDYFDVPDANETTVSPFNAKQNDVTKVVFTQDFYNSQTIKNLNYWFKDFANLKTVEGIQYLYTKGVASCVEAFRNTGLTSIDLSNNDLTGLNTTYGSGLSGMFTSCTSLTFVKFPTANINAYVCTAHLFTNCTSLEDAHFGKLKFEYGISGDTALYNCTKLTEITTNNTWSYNLRNLLFEPEHYSQWTIGSTGEIKEANDIQGNANGDTYTKYDPRVRIDFKNVDGGLNYYPVFNSVPSGVQFYGDDGTEYTSMNANITYAMAMPGSTIYTIREIPNLYWNQIFQTSGSSKKATGIKDDFALQYLKDGESVPLIEDSTDSWTSDKPPTINGFAIADIRSAYESAGLKVCPWSWWICKSQNTYAWFWNSATKRWSMASRTAITYDWISVIVQRDFTASADTNGGNMSMLDVLFDWVSIILNIN